MEATAMEALPLSRTKDFVEAMEASWIVAAEMEECLEAPEEEVENLVTEVEEVWEALERLETEWV